MKIELSRPDIEVVGRIIKSGALQCDLDALNIALKYYKEKCQVCESDDETTKVFKLFIIYGKVSEVSHITKIKQEKVSDILFFKTCEDFELTLLAKYIYSISRTKFCDFLKRQAEIMFTTGAIDVKQEYWKWKMEIYDEEIKKGLITEEEIRENMEMIEFD